MDEKLLIESLSPMERSVLPGLDKGFLDVDSVSRSSGLDKTSALRSIGLLEKKGLVESRVEEIRKVDLGILGVNYLKKELPERALLDRLSEKRIVPIGEIRNACGLFKTN